MVKIITLVILIGASTAFATCPTGDTCISNGTVILGLNPNLGGQADYFALVSDGVNVINTVGLTQGYGGISGASGIWGYADHSLFGQTPGYTSGDYGSNGNFVQWNPNVTSCSDSCATDTYNTPVTTLTTNGTTAYVKSIPLDWNWSDSGYDNGQGGDPDYPDPPYISNLEWATKQGYYELWYTLVNNMVHVTSRYTYTDSFDHSGLTIEPAILTDPTNKDYIGPYNINSANTVDAGSCWGVWNQQVGTQLTTDFTTVYGYDGNNPWTNDPITVTPFSNNSSVGSLTRENWIAMSNSSGKTVGIYVPQNSIANNLDITNGHPSGCLGGGLTFSVDNGLWGNYLGLGLGWNYVPASGVQSNVSGPVFTVDSYYIIGASVGQIRAAYYALHNSAGTMTISSSRN